MGQSYATQVLDKSHRCAVELASVVPADLWAAPVVGRPTRFRNKAKLAVGGSTPAPTLGILDRTYRGIDLRGCGLYERPLAAAIPELARAVAEAELEPYDVARRRGELRHIIATVNPSGKLMVRFVVRTNRGAEAVASALPRLSGAIPALRVASVNIHPEPVAVLEGPTEQVLTPQTTLPMALPDVTLHLGVRSFFQTNTEIATALYRTVQAWAHDLAPTTVWDLYCGVGGFALHLAAPDRTVIGLEMSPEAVRSAARSAEHSPGQVEFHASDAADVAALPRPDLIVVNPPRRGLSPTLVDSILTARPTTVLYSSCNVVTLRRDLEALGPTYRVQAAQMFDMFPQTNHHEVLIRVDCTDR